MKVESIKTEVTMGQGVSVIAPESPINLTPEFIKQSFSDLESTVTHALDKSMYTHRDPVTEICKAIREKYINNL